MVRNGTLPGTERRKTNISILVQTDGKEVFLYLVILLRSRKDGEPLLLGMEGDRDRDRLLYE